MLCAQWSICSCTSSNSGVESWNCQGALHEIWFHNFPLREVCDLAVSSKYCLRKNIRWTSCGLDVYYLQQAQDIGKLPHGLFCACNAFGQRVGNQNPEDRYGMLVSKGMEDSTHVFSFWNTQRNLWAFQCHQNVRDISRHTLRESTLKIQPDWGFRFQPKNIALELAFTTLSSGHCWNFGQKLSGVGVNTESFRGPKL